MIIDKGRIFIESAQRNLSPAITTVPEAVAAVTSAYQTDPAFRAQWDAENEERRNTPTRVERFSRNVGRALAVAAAFVPVVRPFAAAAQLVLPRAPTPTPAPPGLLAEASIGATASASSSSSTGGSTMFENVDWSQMFQTGVNAALQYRQQRAAQRTQLQIAQQQQAIPDFGPMAAGGVGMTPAAFPALPSFLGGVARVGGAVIRRGGALITAAGTAISSRKAVQLAKVLGVQGAAAALGIGAVELAEAVLSDQKRGRRGKGVTAASLRTTRRTMRTVERMHRQIAGYCRDAGVRNTKVVRVPVAAKRCR